MMKKTYLAPQLKVVRFKVENGFEFSKSGAKFETLTPSNRNQAYDLQEASETGQWKPFA